MSLNNPNILCQGNLLQRKKSRVHWKCQERGCWRRVRAICVGDTLLGEFSRCISVMYSDRYLKLPNKVAAVILLSKCSEGTKRNQEGHDMTCKQYIREGSMLCSIRQIFTWILSLLKISTEYLILHPTIRHLSNLLWVNSDIKLVFCWRQKWFYHIYILFI